MRHILIPTDFSNNAWNATIFALRFFMGEKITFHFLHMDLTHPSGDDKKCNSNGFSTKNNFSDKAKIAMELWMNKVRENTTISNHTYIEAIITSTVVNGIKEYLKEKNIHFMVMGTKGASGLKEMAIGSKTGAVITRVKCSILIIPEAATFIKPINIGFPTDFNITYTHKLLNTLVEVAKVHQSTINVLRVAQNQKSLDNYQKNNRDILKQLCNNYTHSFHVIDDPNLENVIQSFVNTMHIDMVVMIAKNLNFFDRILFKPCVTKISYHMQIPFLILHD